MEKNDKKNPTREVVREVLKLRKQEAAAKDTTLYIMIAFAIMVDCVDLIPLAGWLINVFLRSFLFILMIGKGESQDRMVARLIMGGDFVPILGFLPGTIGGVMYLFVKIKRRALEASRHLKKLEREYNLDGIKKY